MPETLDWMTGFDWFILALLIIELGLLAIYLAREYIKRDYD